jgi:hypothetical protein
LAFAGVPHPTEVLTVKKVMIRFGLAVVGSLALAAVAIAADKAPETEKDPSAMWAEMMKGADPDGQKATRELIQSEPGEVR